MQLQGNFADMEQMEWKTIVKQFATDNEVRVVQMCYEDSAGKCTFEGAKGKVRRDSILWCSNRAPLLLLLHHGVSIDRLLVSV